MIEHYCINIQADETEDLIFKKIVIAANEKPMVVWVLVPSSKDKEEELLVN